MANITIEVRDNGPLRIRDEVVVLDPSGEPYPAFEVTALCRCGHSANKPFCDATHRTIGFQSAPRAEV